MTPKQRLDVKTALLAYWTARDEAAAAQAAKGKVDVGGRAGATSGGHLNRIAQLLGRVAIRAGAPQDRVFYKAPEDDPLKRQVSEQGHFTLPGYYRPTKQWDLVVYDEIDKVPIIAVELKSQTGPSYGNNANNRVEESLGSAIDLKRVAEVGLLQELPWLGYVYVIEDDPFSAARRGASDVIYLPRAIEFDDWSYLSRVQMLCRRLVQDKHYNACWAVTTSRPSCPATKKKPENCYWTKSGLEHDSRHKHKFSWRELDAATTGYVQFVEAMSQAVRVHYPPKEGAPPPGQVTLDL